MFIKITKLIITYVKKLLQLILFFVIIHKELVLMSGGIKMRDLVKLICSECKNENYYTDKNKKTTPERLEIKKYCPHCRKHTSHKEKK